MKATSTRVLKKKYQLVSKKTEFEFDNWIYQSVTEAGVTKYFKRHKNMIGWVDINKSEYEFTYKSYNNRPF
ncbi:MAG: hypothetical protein K1X86_15540 [Ignavibacteria bacterium]|nr:hypothetical protein [Ignavibacteria bacterium]